MIIFKKNNNLKNNNLKNNGLTIVELLVVVSIFMIITGISIFNYDQFNSYTGTQNLADDIALTVRQAQSYAVGVRGVEGEDPFNIGYGVSFSSDPNPSYHYAPSSNSFILFADIDGDNLYDYDENNPKCGTPVAGNECLDMLTIDSADEISDLIMDKTLSVPDKENIVNVMFKRPNPEPIFCYSVLGFTCEEGVMSSLGIKVVNQKDPEKIYKTVEISNVGQISVF